MDSETPIPRTSQPKTVFPSRRLITRLREPLKRAEVLDHRAQLCPYYDRCLTDAKRKQWISFTCQFCGKFEQHREYEKLPVRSEIDSF